MRISDWSSDVCSSDLITAMKIAEQRRQIGTTMTHVSRIVEALVERLEGASRRVVPGAEPGGGARKLLDATRSLLDRKSVVEGKGVSVSVDLGGASITQKTNTSITETPLHFNNI